MKILLSLCILCLILAVGNQKVIAEVTITNGQQSLQFEANVRLVQVIEAFGVNPHTYWPAAVIYQQSDNSVEALRSNVLTQLDDLKSKQSDADLDASLAELKNFIVGWPLAKRIPLAIDYDKARIIPSQNPSFKEQGSYILSMPARADSVIVFGATEGISELDYKENQCVGEYYSKVSKSELADKDIVTIIQPDGQILNVGVAYWNSHCEQLMPGSMVYAPFKQGLFSQDNRQLNENIVKLALNRVELKNDK